METPSLNHENITDEEIIAWCKMACEICGTPASSDAEAVRMVLKDAQQHRRGDFDGEEVLWYKDYAWDQEQEEIFDRFLGILDRLENDNSRRVP